MVAKTYDAKAVGITTGMPIWEAKKLLPHATYLSADFRFYGLISEKMFSILRRYSPDMEVYSIDEGFLDLNGTMMLWKKDYKGIAHDIRRTVHREVGITVSVGVSVTRILAKMASEYNKPNGVTIVPTSMIQLFLERVKLSDVCGIGRNRLATLNKVSIHTPMDFINTDIEVIKRLLGKAGTDLWLEMRGASAIGLELHAQLPKTMARTASMGEVTGNRKTIISHLIRHTSRLATELVTKRLLTKRISIFLRLKDFSSVSAKVDFEYPTNNYFRLSHSVQAMMTELYQASELYRACGIIAESITNAENAMPDLFGVMKSDAKQASIFTTMDDINKKYGSGTLRVAGAHVSKISGQRIRFMYPMIMAS
ncbi:DNA polymerase-4/DNA polymerase V [Mariprofundus aestuarium]|uniref:DNA polymerase-4/DNA polymerase V n=1 Tax=Mariprofundus aestuarium TaxID=1921086 RepID=A0A2K8KW95_MARES|nr:DNA polymerase-4/DNA polymerase V [Mariprofundus aestuarium]